MTTAGASRLRKDGITWVRKVLRGVADRTPRFRELPTCILLGHEADRCERVHTRLRILVLKFRSLQGSMRRLSVKPKNRVQARS
jgi:hypothetical protein